MSDEMAERKTAEQQAQASQPPQGRSVTVTITLHPNGSIDFQLPTGNKILSYGLLECARAQLDKIYLVEEQQRAQASRGGVNGLLQRMNGGHR